MFQEQLLQWYHDNKRVLPWRLTSDPYQIWLSEIMLQQTQVKTVIDYFNRFIMKYPDVLALSKGHEEDVLKLWEGLGYYSRARRLIPCARIVVEKFEGEFPEDYSLLLTLPGIGTYTAGAIASIAYNKKVPAVDGNVMRVYSRHFYMKADISKNSSKKIFENKVKETLPEDCRHFNQALMELGALICSPQKPKCLECPINSTCEAYHRNCVMTLPVKSKKIKKKTLQVAVCKILHDDLWMIEKRPNEGLLAGLWGFPIYTYEDDLEVRVKEGLKEDYDLEVLNVKVSKVSKHVFTHLVWEMSFVKVEISKRVKVDFPENKWILKEDISKYPLPTAFKKLL
jgi:A/G-specific adenine glycosylase